MKRGAIPPCKVEKTFLREYVPITATEFSLLLYIWLGTKIGDGGVAVVFVVVVLLVVCTTPDESMIFTYMGWPW